MRGFLRRPRRLSTVVVAAVTLGLAGPVVLGTSAAEAATCPCSIWASTATPATPSDPDTSAVELGVKFRSDVDGQSPASGSTRGPATPARTSATCGTAAGTAAGDRDVHRRDGDRLAAGQLRLAGDHRGEHHVRRLVLRAERSLRRQRQRLRRAASTTRRCMRWPTAWTAATASTGTAPAAASRPAPSRRPTTGWTWSSRRAAPTPPRRR